MASGPLVAVLVAALTSACASSQHGGVQERASAVSSTPRAAFNPDALGLELGAFTLGPLEKAVLDGDTIRVREIDSSLRLLGIDCEETFKRASEKAAYKAGWEQYRRQARADSSRPVKLATPLGEDAKDFARHFFRGVTEVRLERDHPEELRDVFGRYLVYVFAKKDGEWKNFNLEVVRAGMSPYFNKYGNSRRFHPAFVQAQAEAQAAKRGIWDPNGQHYGDYPERLAWWNERAAMLEDFEKRMETSKDHFVLTRYNSLELLQQQMGRTVSVFGAVSRLRTTGKGPKIARISRAKGSDLDIVFFDYDLFEKSGLAKSEGEFVEVRGTVSEYRRTEKSKPRIQIVVTQPAQVVVPNASPSSKAASAESVEAQ